MQNIIKKCNIEIFLYDNCSDAEEYLGCAAGKVFCSTEERTKGDRGEEVSVSDVYGVRLGRGGERIQTSSGSEGDKDLEEEMKRGWRSTVLPHSTNSFPNYGHIHTA